MENVVEFPRFTRWGPNRSDERQRLAKMFAGKSKQEMRDIWDSFSDVDSFCGPIGSDPRRFDCADVHSYMNMLGDGVYCAV